MKTLLSISVASLILVTVCDASNANSKTLEAKTFLNTQEKLGKALFFDKNLSRTRHTSCSTCHNPKHGFIDARFRKKGVNQKIFMHGAFSVGDNGKFLGGRNAPTALYAMFSPKFSKLSDGSYIGGQFHDGRAATLAVQAGGPPLDAAEMMQPNKKAVIERIKENKKYVKTFKKLYGNNIFDDINTSYEAMKRTIASFEKTKTFQPFSSKYDRYRKCIDSGQFSSICLKQGHWTIDEQLGFSLFFTQGNTNCAMCHTLSGERNDFTHELFTNYKYENIGAPRNIAAMDRRAALGLQDKNATFRGLGATIEKTDPNWRKQLGKTKVPTLRNIAITGPYMDNGVFRKLRTVLDFYDHMAGHGGHPINPETGKSWGKNDHIATIDFAKLHATKALTDRKIRALEAFLRTLTDKRYEHLLPKLAPVGALGN